jgi:hypothetical protein
MGTTTTTQLGLANDPAKMHRLFGKKLYSDKYAFISEICQNAEDSHRMAGNKEPFEVGIDKNEDGYVFYVKDYGLSFESKQDFVEKICTLLASGKSSEKTSSEDTPMGEHGVGSISVVAFAPTWSYTVVKNNRKFKATLQDEEGRGLTHDLQESSWEVYDQTYEDKYVLFEVQVPYNGEEKLIEAMKTKLAYFQNVQFQFHETLVKRYPKLLTLNTEFKLLRNEDFQLSTLSPHKEMHVCLDQYSYAINWNKLGIPKIELNIALRFKMGEGLSADLTRENLELNDGYSEAIKAKLRKVSTWFTERYNARIKDKYTSIIECIIDYSSGKWVKVNNMSFDIAPLLGYSDVYAKHIEFEGVDDDVLHKFITKTDGGTDLFKATHEITTTGKKMKRSFSDGMTPWSGNKPWTPGFTPNCVLMDEKPAAKILAYIKETYKGKYLYERAKFPFKYSNKGWSWTSILDFKGQKRQASDLYKMTGLNLYRIKLSQMEKLIEAAEREYFIKASTIQIPVEYKEKPVFGPVRKAKVDLATLEGEVGIRYAQPMSKWSSDWACKFDEETIKVRELYKQPYFHVYGSEGDREALDQLYRLTKGKGNTITPCIITPTQQKHIEKLNLHNFMRIQDFYAGKHKQFRKMITAYIIRKELVDKYEETFKSREIIRDYVSVGFAGDLGFLQSYADQYDISSSIYRDAQEIMTPLLELAKEGKLYDLEVWDIVQRVQKEIEKFDFVNFLKSEIQSYRNNEAKKGRVLLALQDIARHRKIRMHWEYYNLFDFETV